MLFTFFVYNILMGPEKPFTSNEQNSDNPWLKESLFENSGEHQVTVEIPEKSPDFTCDFFLEQIKRSGKWGDLKKYINQSINAEPKTYGSPEEFMNANPGYMEAMHSLSAEDKKALREYTGYYYTWINSLSRGFWDYRKMGPQTDEQEAHYQEIIKHVRAAIDHAPAPAEDFVTYRGTNMRTFTGYDIGSIRNLKKMQGQFFVEKGFMSTSLSRNRSFLNHDFSGTLHDNCNIEIIYHIPAGSNDSAALLSEDVSSAVAQQEVVINNYTLNYISDVTIVSPDHAIVDMVMVPKNLYDQPPKK